MNDEEKFAQELATTDYERDMVESIRNEISTKTDAEVMTLCEAMEQSCPEFRAYKKDYFDPKKRILGFFSKSSRRELPF